MSILPAQGQAPFNTGSPPAGRREQGHLQVWEASRTVRHKAQGLQTAEHPGLRLQTSPWEPAASPDPCGPRGPGHRTRAARGPPMGPPPHGLPLAVSRRGGLEGQLCQGRGSPAVSRSKERQPAAVRGPRVTQAALSSAGGGDPDSERRQLSTPACTQNGENRLFNHKNPMRNRVVPAEETSDMKTDLGTENQTKTTERIRKCFLFITAVRSEMLHL